MRWWMRCPLEEGTKFQVLAPVVRQRKGTQQKELDAARRAGYARVRIDGSLYDLDEEITLEKSQAHRGDRSGPPGPGGRCAAAWLTGNGACPLTGGLAEVDVIGGRVHDL